MFSKRKLAFLAALCLYCGHSIAQVQTPRPGVNISDNIGGFYEYLPQGYESGGDTYPLIIFLHGQGDLGNGTTQLSVIANAGIPGLITRGSFPASFTVDGQTFRFIVISPQFKSWPTAVDVAAVITYATLNYRVNANRIYLTGLSMGGGGVWDYAGLSVANSNKLAALVPVCGASYPTSQAGRNMANANLPVWATHNDQDPMVPYFYSQEYVRLINLPPAPDPPARLTTFNSTSHDAWTATYDPNTTIFDGGNIYSWMLHYSRGAAAPLPVKLSAYTAELVNGNKVTVSWTTSFEQNNDHFNIERSSDGSNFTSIGTVTARNLASGAQYNYDDATPLSGTSYYRLTQTDIDGRVTVFDAMKISIITSANATVRIYPNPATDKITVELQNALRGTVSFAILNATGRRIKLVTGNKSSPNLKQSISINELSPGYYILEIKGDNYSYSSSIIKK